MNFLELMFFMMIFIIDINIVKTNIKRCQKYYGVIYDIDFKGEAALDMESKIKELSTEETEVIYL